MSFKQYIEEERSRVFRVGKTPTIGPLENVGTKKAVRQYYHNWVSGSKIPRHLIGANVELGNVHDLEADLEDASPRGIATRLHQQKILDNDQLASVQKSKNPKHTLLTHLQAKGIDTLSYTNEVEDRGKKSYMMVNPDRQVINYKASRPSTKLRVKGAPPSIRSQIWSAIKSKLGAK